MNILKFKKIKLLLVLFLSVLQACNNNETIILSKNGKFLHTIISSDETEKIAQTLGSYLSESTGDNPNITKNLSETNPYILIRVNDSFSKPTISYKAEGNSIIIEGSDEKYLHYAVFEFLETQVGIRFYTDKVEYIPQLDKLEISKDLNFSYAPKIETRTAHSKLFYNNHDFADKQKVTYEAFPYYVKGAGVHTFNKFVPPTTYYDSHPEYYALINGERKTTQLCLTNDKVLDIVINAVQNSFDNDPEASVISVSTNDNTQYCRCDNCAQIDKEEDSQAGSLIRFVNKVAKQFPDKTISTLAYQHTRKACKTRPEPNVLITLCSIECDRSAAITDKCTDFANDLRDWKNLTENIRIWDYTVQFTNFLAPFPNIHTLQPNIKFFADNNAKWIFQQHSNNNSSLFELRSYLLAKLLWNPEQPSDEIIKEFCNGYYEEAGPFIENYVQELTKQIKAHPNFFLFLYGGPSQAFDSFLSSRNIDSYNQIFDQAEAAVNNKPEVLKRVQVARLGVRYATLEACRASVSEKYSLNNADFVKKEFDMFFSTCENTNIKLMNETRFYVSDYKEMYKRNIERLSGNNLALGKPVTLLSKPKKYANEDPQSLTDGIPGGGSFYANWLGFEGNDMIAVVDLEKDYPISEVSLSFLQVMNHLVSFPKNVSISISSDGKNYNEIAIQETTKPINKESKTNDVEDFNFSINKTARFIKIKANSIKTMPPWHHGTGLPSWIFADEIVVN
jgi:hypothetical protein